MDRRDSGLTLIAMLSVVSLGIANGRNLSLHRTKLLEYLNNHGIGD
jgi:hypothetical protein